MCWEKLTNNLAKFFNSWLRRERHHNISVFFIEHIDKVGSLLNGHHRGIHKWKGFFSPKVSMKIMANIAKGETYPTHVYIGGFIKVLIRLFSLPMRFRHVGPITMYFHSIVLFPDHVNSSMQLHVIATVR